MGLELTLFERTKAYEGLLKRQAHPALSVYIEIFKSSQDEINSGGQEIKTQ